MHIKNICFVMDKIIIHVFLFCLLGVPKGVMLTHKNVISCVSSLVMGYGVSIEALILSLGYNNDTCQ